MPGGRVWKVHPGLGKPRSEETKAKLREAHLGKKISAETRAKMSASQQKHKTHKVSEAGRKSISESKMDEKNPMWKGDKVQHKGNESVHNWVHRRKTKPEVCENCKVAQPRDLANISQEYKRDVNDYKWLCRRCHLIEDGRIKTNLVNMKGRKLSEETKTLIGRKSMGRRHTQETKEKMRIIMKGMKKMTPAGREKVRLARLNNPYSRGENGRFLKGVAA